jgi:hypothetical protein
MKCPVWQESARRHAWQKAATVSSHVAHGLHPGTMWMPQVGTSEVAATLQGCNHALAIVPAVSHQWQSTTDLQLAIAGSRLCDVHCPKHQFAE